MEVGEASTLRLLGAEQENAELRKRLEELQAQQEVRVQRLQMVISSEEFQLNLANKQNTLGCLRSLATSLGTLSSIDSIDFP